MTADNGLDDGTTVPRDHSGDGSNDLDLGVVHGPPAPKRKRGVSFKRYPKRYKPTGHRPGRPTNQEVEFRKRIDSESKKEARARAPKFGPPIPKGLGWGGKRKGAGRPKRVGPPKNKIAMVRMDRALAEKLEALPPGKRSQYVRQALNLLTEIQPPEKFLALGQESVET